MIASFRPSSVLARGARRSVAAWLIAGGRLRGGTVVAAVALVVGVMATPQEATAQAYRAEEIDSKLSSRGAIVKRYLRNPTSEPADRQEYEGYFERYYFPSMTQPTDAGLAGLEKLRVDLFKNFLWPATPELHKDLAQRAARFAVRVIKGAREYHPAVRYNAILVMGGLDANPANAPDGPKPDPRANALLCNLAGRAAGDPSVPRYELAAVLVGLERHTRYFDGLPQDNQRRTVAALGNVMRAENLRGEASRTVRDWLLTQSVEALANTRIAGRGGALFKAIAAKAGDDKLSLETRAEIAANLAKLRMPPGKLSSPPVVETLQSLAVAVAQREAESASEFEDLNLRGGRAGFAPAGPVRNQAGQRFKQDDREWVFMREGLVALLTDVQRGVQATRAAADEAGAATMAPIDEALGEAIRAATNDDIGDLALADAIKTMTERIEAAAAAAVARAADSNEAR